MCDVINPISVWVKTKMKLLNGAGNKKIFPGKKVIKKILCTGKIIKILFTEKRLNH